MHASGSTPEESSIRECHDVVQRIPEHSRESTVPWCGLIQDNVVYLEKKWMDCTSLGQLSLSIILKTSLWTM